MTIVARNARPVRRYLALTVLAAILFEGSRGAWAAGLTRLSSVGTGAAVTATDVAVSGSYAYLVTADDSSPAPELHVFDVSDPSSPRLVGGIDLQTSVNAIVVAGAYAYLATKRATEELMIIDVSDKSRPLKAKGYDIPSASEATSVAALGGWTVVVGTPRRPAGPELYAVRAIPDNARLLGTLELDADVNDLAFDGRSAVLAATSHDARELVTIDVGEPKRMSRLRAADIPGAVDAVGVGYEAGKAYLLNAAAGPDANLFVLDGASLATLGSANVGGVGTAVVVEGTRAFVTTRAPSASLAVIDVSQPASPVRAAALAVGADAVGIADDGRHVFVASAEGTAPLQVVETGSPAVPHSAATSGRPVNVVLIVTDDQRWDSLRYMPTVYEAFVRDGSHFVNGFVTTSLCCPSRASILTGQYAHDTGVRTNREPTGGALAFNDSSTLATWFDGAGYATALIGKYLNQYAKISPRIPPGWDEWRVFVDQPGGNFYDEFTLNENGTVVAHGGGKKKVYSTDVLRDLAVDFIRAHAEKPFFLVFAPYAPHTSDPESVIVAPRHRGTFGALAPQRPPSFEEQDLSAKPQFWRQRAALWKSSVADSRAAVDRFRILQIEALQAVDEAVKSIVDAVEAMGIANHTVLVYMSDNGIAHGEHYHRAKSCAYDECIRVPLAIRYPPLTTRRHEESRLVLNIDLAPTLGELTGVPVPARVGGKDVDGRSFVDMLKGVRGEWRKDFLAEGWNDGSAEQPPTYGAVRTEEWKYVSNHEKSGRFEELYDLSRDPFEVQNLAGKSEHAPLLQQLRTRLKALRDE